MPNTDAPDYIPHRLVVKVQTEFQVRGAKRAAAAIAGLKLKTQALGAPDISPLVPPAALDHAGLSAAVAVEHPASRVYIFDFPKEVNLERIKAEIEGQSWVEYVEYDYLLELYDTPDDPLFGWQWSLQNTGQEIPLRANVWDTCVAGFDVDFMAVYNHPGPHHEVIVGIIDTGSDINHEDLADHLWHNPGEIPENDVDDDHNGYVDDYYGYDFVGNGSGFPDDYMPDSDPTDYFGHGTHVAGTVTAVIDNALGMAGLASSARIMTLKIFPSHSLTVAAEAVYYAVDNGADVFNMSFGGPYPLETLSEALVYARSRDVLPVASSGNNGVPIENHPSVDSAVISVGALDCRGHVADWSTFGDFLDVIAPGVAILSLRAAGTDMYGDGLHTIDEKYYIASGTSMSAPHVTGCAAALLAIEPGLTADRLVEILKSTCTDIVDPYGWGESFPGWDQFSGHGLVNLGRALNELAGITIKIEAPGHGDMLSGLVTIAGTAAGPAFTEYQLDYGSGENPGSWISLTSGVDPIDDDSIFTWNTGSLTGVYTLRLRAPSGHEDRVTVTLANTAMASISDPPDGDTIAILQTFSGSAVAPDYLYAVIAYAPEETPSDTTIVWSTTAPVVEDSLFTWQVDPGIDGWHYFKLTTVTASHTYADSVLVYIDDLIHPGWPSTSPTQIFGKLAAADIDGDGKKEIVAPRQHITTSGGVYVFREDGSIAPGWPVDTVVDFRAIPAMADLNHDGQAEVIIVAKNDIYVYTGSGLPFASWPRYFRGALHAWGVAVPVVCDLDGNYAVSGIPEILAIDKDGKIEAHNASGSYYTFTEATEPLQVEETRTALPAASVVDLDGGPGGRNELIVAADGLWIWDAKTGAPYNAGGAQIRTYAESHGMAVGNFDADNALEIAVAYRPVGETMFHVEVMKADGTTLPGWPVSTGVSNYYYLQAHDLAAGDVDGDGLPELFLAPYSIGGGIVLAYRADGTPLLDGSPDGIFLQHYSSLSSVILTDLTGDVQPEIVIQGGMYWGGLNRLYALYPNGEFVPGYPLFFGTGLASTVPEPLVTDLNGDGMLNLITLETSQDIIRVWDLPYEYHLAGRPWPKFRRDNWNSGILPSAAHYDIVYIVKLIHYMFRSGTMYFPPYQIPDADCDGIISITDLVIIINYVYREGPVPCLP